MLATTLFFSCEQQQEIGVELEPDGELIQTVFSDTFTINTYVTQLDSVVTFGQNLLMAGGYQDPEFKTQYEAEAYARMSIGSLDTVDFVDRDGNKATYDSMFLLMYLSYSYGDTTQPQEFEVYRLQEGMDDSVVYSSQDVLQTFGEPIGRARFPEDVDSLGMLRFKISDDLGREFFAKGGQRELYDQESFKEYFKGIKIRSTTPNAAVMGFDVAVIKSNVLQESRLSIYYHFIEEDEDTQELDTINRTFSFGFTNRFNFIRNDLTSHPYMAGLQPLANYDTREMEGLGYIQEGTGIVTRLEFPHLEAFAQKGRFLINRAELVLEPVVQTAAEHTPPPSRLVAILADETGRPLIGSGGGPVFLADEQNPNGFFSLNYQAGGRIYVAERLTSYLQRLIDGEEENHGIILRSENTGRSVSRLLFEDNGGQIAPLKLRVYYTQVPE